MATDKAILEAREGLIEAIQGGKSLDDCAALQASFLRLFLEDRAEESPALWLPALTQILSSVYSAQCKRWGFNGKYLIGETAWRLYRDQPPLIHPPESQLELL